MLEPFGYGLYNTREEFVEAIKKVDSGGKRMTEEEKVAHEYAIENWEHYEEGQSDYDALKQAVLYGLKAGRLKWHKVADGDLPEAGVPVVGFYYGRDNWHKVYLRADGHWWGDGSLCQPPYVWQEIVPSEYTKEAVE